MKKAIKKMLPIAYGKYYNTLSYFSKDKAANKAFKLFVKPRKGRVLPQQKAFLEASKKEIIQVDGIDIQTYHWPGENDTVILFHGWESNAFRWRLLVAHLKEANYNMIACDAPGHGNSTGNILYVPLYQKTAAQLLKKYKPSIAIGHSMGGMMLLYNQYINPNNGLQKIVSLGAPAELEPIMKVYYQALRLSDRMIDGIEGFFMNEFNFDSKSFSVENWAHQLKLPCLIIHDEDDQVIPVRAAKLIHKNWKDSKLILTKKLGHSLHQEAVNKSIVDFINNS
jgi:pimeloyl-ACP methyl ester carboxylesterase